MIKCDHDYCIYNENCQCIFAEIEIDGAGLCRTCILVHIQSDELEDKKTIHRREVENN